MHLDYGASAVQKRMRIASFVAAAAGLGVWLTPLHATQPLSTWSCGLLTVHARGHALGQVLKDVERSTGIRVTGADRMEEPVAVDLDRVPLVQGLRTLLGSRNYMIVEGARRTTAMVLILGTSTEVQTQAPMASRPVAGASPIAASDAQLERNLRDVDPAVRVESVERIAERGDQRSLALLRQALSDSNEAVRAVAQQALATRPPLQGPQQLRNKQ